MAISKEEVVAKIEAALEEIKNCGEWAPLVSPTVEAVTR